MRRTSIALRPRSSSTTPCYNLLFRGFLDMDMVEPAFDATVFTKNWERLLTHAVTGEFFRAVVEQARSAKGAVTTAYYCVDAASADQPSGHAAAVGAARAGNGEGIRAPHGSRRRTASGSTGR